MQRFREQAQRILGGAVQAGGPGLRVLTLRARESAVFHRRPQPDPPAAPDLGGQADQLQAARDVGEDLGRVVLLAEGETTHIVVTSEMKIRPLPEKYLRVFREAAGRSS